MMMYLQDAYPEAMEDSGLYPKDCEREINENLEWYSGKLRPFIKQYNAFVVARWKAGYKEMNIPDQESENEKYKNSSVAGDATPKSLTSDIAFGGNAFNQA